MFVGYHEEEAFLFSNKIKNESGTGPDIAIKRMSFNPYGCKYEPFKNRLDFHFKDTSHSILLNALLSGKKISLTIFADSETQPFRFHEAVFLLSFAADLLHFAEF
jgi:hypothetical protein